MYHRNYLSAYVLAFKPEVEIIIAANEDEVNSSELSNKITDDILENLQLKDTAYSVSSVRDLINEEFQSNRIGKTIRIITTYFRSFCRKLEN